MFSSEISILFGREILQVSPGLSSYASDPEDAGTSLAPLLAKAENVVPKSYLSQTPLRLGATAGLRALDTSTAQKIIQAVRNFLKANTKLKYSEKYVTIIDGSTEGEFLWVSMNYLLGNLGKKYSNTVGVVDLGGGSVQMAYAISAKAAKNSPKTSDGEELYVKEYTYKGKTYHLYVHSYMNYGLNAAKVEILKAIGGAGNPCILKGYNGSFTYNEVVYQVSASNYGASYQKCRQGAIKALKVNTACPYKNCTFGGVWNGDGGYGQRNLYVASFFYDRAAQVGFINSSAPSAKVKPVAFAKAAKSICQMSLQEANSTLTKVYQDSIPFICMDLVYEYTLLTDGFGLDPYQEITLVTEVEYKSYKVGAAWALGGALDLISSSSSVSLL